SSLQARIHALWTLEGLEALQAPLVREMFKDSAPQMRVQAIRLSETLYKAGDQSFGSDQRAMVSDSDTNVAIQALLTLDYLSVPNALDAVQSAVTSRTEFGVQ